MRQEDVDRLLFSLQRSSAVAIGPSRAAGAGKNRQEFSRAKTVCHEQRVKNVPA